MSITQRGIHLVSGDSAAGNWLHTFTDQDRLLRHGDSLTSGPLCPQPSLHCWNTMRESFWHRICPELCDELTPASARPPANMDLIQNLDRLRATNRAYIWAGTDVDDQLFLLFVVNLMLREGIDRKTIHLVPFDTRTDLGLPFYSVARLSPDDLKAHPTPEPLTEEQLQVCSNAWEAITAPTPDAMEAILRSGNASMPHVLRTVGQLLRRFSRRETGLSLLDNILLESVKNHAPNVARVIGEALCDIWLDGDNVGDAYLYHRLRLLSIGPSPLLKLQNGSALYREAKVEITEMGRNVLDGHASAFPSNTTDEWIGGVHISSEEGNLWMYENNVLRNFAE